MKLVSGTLDGTGAAINVGIGFKPDFVKLWNLESTNPFYAEWNVGMRTAQQVGGYSIDNATPARYVEVAGISQYLGGDTADGTETYLMHYADVLGQGNLAKAGPVVAAGKALTTWTLGSAANRTGNWNAVADTTYIGIGSKIRITGTLDKQLYETVIMVLTSNGEQANEVELAAAVPSGTIDFIGPIFDYRAATSGNVLPAGFTISSTGNLNSDGETICFEAGTYL